MMMSPARSVMSFERYAIVSGTFQIISERSPFCVTLPFTLSQIAPLAGMADHRDRLQRGARRGVVERLAHLPRAAHFLRLALQVAARHVEPDAVAEDVVERFLDRDVRAALADRDDHLDLVVQVFGHLRIRESSRRSCTIASAGFMKKNGGSRSGSWPISRACSA